MNFCFRIENFAPDGEKDLNHDINTADDWKYAENFAKKNKKYL